MTWWMWAGLMVAPTVAHLLWRLLGPLAREVWWDLLCTYRRRL